MYCLTLLLPRVLDRHFGYLTIESYTLRSKNGISLCDVNRIYWGTMDNQGGIKVQDIEKYMLYVVDFRRKKNQVLSVATALDKY